MKILRIAQSGWVDSLTEDAEDVLGGDLDEHMEGEDFGDSIAGYNCPECGRKGDMLNPSMPTVYDCPICDIKWNPDNLPEFAQGSRGDRPSLKKIWHFQNKMYTEDNAATMLEDFIFKALKVGYPRERIIQGLEEFYRQHPSSGEGIYERAIAKL